MNAKETLLTIFRVSMGLQEMPSDFDFSKDENVKKMQEGLGKIAPMLGMISKEMKEKMVEGVGKAIDKTIVEKGENFTPEDIQPNLLPIIMQTMMGGK